MRVLGRRRRRQGGREKECIPSILAEQENEIEKYGIMELPKSDAILLSKKI
jgi:hypothetical protein